MSTDLVPHANVDLGTLRADSPGQLVAGANQIAGQLSQIIEQRKLYANIQGRRYVVVEGWTTLLALLGIVPQEVSNQSPDDGATYIATVELVRMNDGQVVGRASAECGADEPAWASRPRYARRSMAATRATGKAARLAFSWIVSLAGYEATPAEEMPTEPAQPRSTATIEVLPPVDDEDDANPFSKAKFYKKHPAKSFKDRDGHPRPVWDFSTDELTEKKDFAQDKGWESWIKAIDSEIERRIRYDRNTKTEPAPEGDDLPF